MKELICIVCPKAVSYTHLGPHAHSTTFSPDGRFAFVPDLGIDKLVAYEPDYTTGKLAADVYKRQHLSRGPLCAVTQQGVEGCGQDSHT